MKKDEIDILMEFLSFPISSTKEIIEKVKTIPNAIHRKGENELEEFVYIPGKRKNKVLLVAHVDTYWDQNYVNTFYKAEIIKESNYIYNNNGLCGIGADDRAGCAMLWLLKDSGHSLLFTNGEEHGQIGSNWLISNEDNEDIKKNINDEHQFIIQLDRRGSSDYKCYNVGTDEFRRYIEENTGYTEPDRSSRTDIVVLCEKICGVNLSIGYENEHTINEKLNITYWQNTLNILRKWLKEKNFPRFIR